MATIEIRLSFVGPLMFLFIGDRKMCRVLTALQPLLHLRKDKFVWVFIHNT
ncbi:hypothetical protein Hdeb2414_s0016g00479851 [Helianthus debilis subsp. tardiflorus]